MDAKMMLESLSLFEKEKEIPRDIVISILKESIEKAYKKYSEQPDSLCKVEIDEKKMQIKLFKIKNVVEDVEDDLNEIDLKEAKEKDKNLEIGDEYKEEIDVDILNRVAVKQATQVFIQKIREFEKKAEYEPYIDKIGEIITGRVEQIGKRNINNVPEFLSINIGKTKAVLRSEHIIPGENFHKGDIVKVYVVDVDKNAIGAPVIVSRTHPGFLKRVFESEIPEVYDGTVEIKHIVRQPGQKSKVSVFSRNNNVEPTGACIGPKGIRIQKISTMLKNERIDVINYYEDDYLYISEALKPAKVIGVHIDEEDVNEELNSSENIQRKAIAIVDEEDYSLAIGKRGINAKLAVKITRYSIDIMTLQEAVEQGIDYKLIEQVKDEVEAKKRKEIEEKRASRVRKVVVKTKEDNEEQQIEEETIDPKPSIDERRLKELVKTVESSKPKQKFKSKSKSYGNDKDEYHRAPKPITSKKVEELKKKHEEARSQMPVYDDDDLKDFEESNLENDSYYNSDIDFEDFDDYYEED